MRIRRGFPEDGTLTGRLPLMDDAVSSLGNGRDDRAIGDLVKSAARSGTGPAWFNVGLALLEHGRAAAAATAFQRSLAVQGGTALAPFIFIGACHWIGGRSDEAVAWWRRGLETSSTDAEARIIAPALLYYAGSRSGDLGVQREGRSLLRKAWRPSLLRAWPGAIVAFLLDKLDEIQFLHGQTFQQPALETRRACRANFWAAVHALAGGRTEEADRLFAVSARTERASLEVEHYLARYEVDPGAYGRESEDWSGQEALPPVSTTPPIKTYRGTGGLADRTYYLQRIQVGAGPSALLVSSVTNRVYVASSIANTVTAIDGIAGRIATVFRVGDHPHRLAIDPTIGRVYVANARDGTASILGDAEQAVIGNVRVGSWPLGLAVDPKAHAVYVTCSDDNRVVVVDGRTMAVRGALSVPGRPADIAYSPAGRILAVASVGSGTLHLIDDERRIVVGAVRVGALPRHLTVRPGTPDFLLLAKDRRQRSHLCMVDGQTGQLRFRVPLGYEAEELLFDSLGRQLFTINRESGSVVTIRVDGFDAFTKIETGGKAQMLALDENLRRLYVGTASTDEVVVVDTTDRRVLGALPIQVRPSAMVLAAHTHALFVASYDSASLIKVTPGSA